MANFFKDIKEMGIWKTLRFNFHYFPFFLALRCPVLISKHTRITALGGHVSVPASSRFGTVKFGFCPNALIDFKTEKSIWNNNGEVVFKGRCRLSAGVRLVVGGKLEIGKGVIINGVTKIVAQKHVSIDEDSMISWGCRIIDTDFHKILDADGNRVNCDKEIRIGEKCWIGADSLILKGVELPSGTVIAAGSVVTRPVRGERPLCGGNPAKVIKEGMRWKF